MKVHRPVNKKIIPEKLIKYIEDHPDAYLKEIAEVFGCCQYSVLKRLRKLGITRKKRVRSIYEFFHPVQYDILPFLYKAFLQLGT